MRWTEAKRKRKYENNFKKALTLGIQNSVCEKAIHQKMKNSLLCFVHENQIVPILNHYINKSKYESALDYDVQNNNFKYFQRDA